jgi:hypothetical protein
MNVDQSRIDELLARLSESLTVEVKRWISADELQGLSKIVRGALALRNRNGGYFVIGFDDKTLQPDIGNEPPDVRAAFHIDKIQGLISRYASELFEVAVVFDKHGGREYPVIVVPDGVRSPVAAKRDLFDDKRNELIGHGEVYFRTLSANGTPSTAAARPQDGIAASKVARQRDWRNASPFLAILLKPITALIIISSLGKMRCEEQGYEPTIRRTHRLGHSECNNRLGVCRSLRRPNHTVAEGSTTRPRTNAGVGRASSDLCPVEFRR